MEFPDFLSYENMRNKASHRVFERFMKLACGHEDVEVIVAHHITFMEKGASPIEVPSADTLMFSPVLMGAAFGANAAPMMLALAGLTPEGRSTRLLSMIVEEEQRRATVESLKEAAA